jgi:hypothetical protein
MAKTKERHFEDAIESVLSVAGSVAKGKPRVGGDQLMAVKGRRGRDEEASVR